MVLQKEKLLIMGDFNFHIENIDSYSVKNMIDLLDEFGLKQHVSDATSKHANHVLDLIITRNSESLIHDTAKISTYLSDHASIVFQLNSSNHKHKELPKSYRPLNKIDLIRFKQDLRNSDIVTKPKTELNELVNQYNSCLCQLLDKHAPLRVKKTGNRNINPWYNENIHTAKQKFRQAERKWRKDHTDESDRVMVELRKTYSKVLHRSKVAYYSEIIEKNKSNQKQLFQIIKKLKQDNGSTIYPEHSSKTQLANEFSDYFEAKITKIRAKFPSTSKFNEYDKTVDVTPLTSFQPLSNEDIRKLILSAAPKSYSLDPIPTSLLKDCIKLLLPSISKVINMSLIQGEMPEGFKHAVVTPLPKKTDVDPTFKNCRPESNLPFLSKMIEKAVSIQLLNHTNSHNLCENLQSPYRCHHSTETALIKIMNDLLLEADNQKVILMGFLDLSAAFDTVDHCILLHRLEKMFRIEDKALDWFRTYLTGRTQSVVVGDCESHKKVLECCVSQGSGLGPDLYCKYTLPLGIIIRMFHILFHMYADDTQLYKSIDPSNFENQKQTAEQLHLCTSEISNWMSNNRLKLNEEKTEFLIAVTGRQTALQSHY